MDLVKLAHVKQNILTVLDDVRRSVDSAEHSLLWLEDLLELLDFFPYEGNFSQEEKEKYNEVRKLLSCLRRATKIMRRIHA